MSLQVKRLDLQYHNCVVFDEHCRELAMASRVPGVLRSFQAKWLQSRAGSSGSHCWLCAHSWLRG